MTKEMQQTFTIRPLLAVVCVCLVGFTPSTHAQDNKAEEGARKPISKDELIAHSQDKRVVDGYVIKGNDIIEIITETHLDITIENSVIEDGLDFGELPKIRLEDVTLPAIWSDKEKEEWIKSKRSRKIKKIPVVTNKIIITNTEIRPLQQPSQSADSVAVAAEAALFQFVDFGGNTINGRASFSGATFSEAYFYDAIFSGEASFRRAAFSGGADFFDATFSGVAFFRRATFSGVADFSRATFSRVAFFPRANLRRANLRDANFSGADLTGADLTGANLTNSNLKGTTLVSTQLTLADLSDSSLQPKEFQIRDVVDLLGTKGLSDLHFDVAKIVALRKRLKEAGFQDQEKALTSALRKHQIRTTRSLADEAFLGIVLGGAFTDFGAEPFGALKMLFLVTLVFCVPYLLALQAPDTQAGVWRVRPKDRLLKVPGEKNPELIRFDGFWRAVPTAFYFTLLSTFHFGWRELNVGNWVVRLQLREYTLQATGWVRMTSGLQSLLSLYLVALWLITTFGRPFE